jgi:hypothetical protein
MSVTFETGSQLQLIEKSAFSLNGLQTIIIPAGVKILCGSCFSPCCSLTSVTFETGLNLQRVEGKPFADCPRLHQIELPRSVHEFDRLIVFALGFSL